MVQHLPRPVRSDTASDQTLDGVPDNIPDGEFFVNADEVATPYARAMRDEKHEAELDESLRQKGQLVAGVVSSRRIEGRWVLLEGHTRLISIRARNISLRVRVERSVTDEASERAFIHTSGLGRRRSDLDIAANLQAFIDNDNRSQAECAKLFGMSAGQVSKLLSRYNLPESIRAMLKSGSLPLAHIEVLRKLPKTKDGAHDEARMCALAGRAVAEKLTEAQLLAMVVKPKRGPKPVKMDSHTVGQFTLSWPSGLSMAQVTDGADKVLKDLFAHKKAARIEDVAASTLLSESKRPDKAEASATEPPPVTATEGQTCTSNGS